MDTSMLHDSGDFESLLASFDNLDLESTSSVIYGIRPDYRIAYVNPGWDKFATDNSDGTIVSSKWGIGSSVFDAISPVLRTFYKELFDLCLDTSQPLQHPLQHEFECSSTEKFRRFRMTLYRLPDAAGILVVNSLVVEKDHDAEDRIPHSPIETEYLHSDGFIHQCMYCRKVRHAHEDNRWDWVPHWVSMMHPETSHGLCGLCANVYFESRGVDLSA